jgi:mRNA interferase HicA
MKRNALLQHLRKHGCTLKREGAAHSLWTNPANGAVEAVPRHTENRKQSGTEDLPRPRHTDDGLTGVAVRRLSLRSSVMGSRTVAI